LGLNWEQIIPAMAYSYTQVLQQPDLIWHDRNGVAHIIMSNEAVARVFRRLGCEPSCSASYDEQGRFASVYFGEVPLQGICLSYTLYMSSNLQSKYYIYSWI
jgi:hypothetical protein